MKNQAKVPMHSFYLHCDDQNNPNGFNEVWRSRTCPVFDGKTKSFYLTPEGKAQDDRLVHVSLWERSLLPEGTIEGVRKGAIAHVFLATCVEWLDKDGRLMTAPVVPMQQNSGGALQVITCNDNLIFGQYGTAKLYDRQGAVFSHTETEEVGGSPLKVEYFDRYCDVIRHPGTGSVHDYYHMIGFTDKPTTPIAISKLWISDRITKVTIDSLLVDAYKKGLRFIEAPDSDEIEFTAKVFKDGIFTLECESDFYGFGGKLTFSASNGFKPDEDNSCNSLERTIINSIVAYRWFFNRPNLIPKISVFKGDAYTNENCWNSKKEFADFKKRINAFEKKTLKELNAIIASSIEEKWGKRCKRSKHFDPNRMILDKN